MSSIFKSRAFITDRRLYPHMICYWPQILKSRKYVTMGPENIWSHHRRPKLTLPVCYVKRGRGLVMYIFSQERFASDCSGVKYNVLRSANVVSFLLFSLVCVSSETHNLQRVFLRIFNAKGELYQAFPSETVEIGTKNRCVIEATNSIASKFWLLWNKWTLLSGRKTIRLLIIKTAMAGVVNFHCMQMLLWCDDWNDVPYKSLFWSMAMM